MNEPDRVELDFVQKVRGSFSFLASYGFTETESAPTLVRYRNGDIEIDVYHGRQSYEIGGGVTFSGNRFSMSEIVRAGDAEAANGYRNAVATTPQGVDAGLGALSLMMQRYGSAVLNGDLEFFSSLEILRKSWAEAYAVDVLAAQLRPRAEEAFRRGEFAVAADLYGQFRACLTPAEVKKLAVSESRRE